MTSIADRQANHSKDKSSSSSAERIGWCLVLAMSGLTIWATLVQMPGVTSDPSWGILAAHQYLLGKSPNFHTITSPDSENLLRDHASWISWWPPSYQAVPLAF